MTTKRTSALKTLAACVLALALASGCDKGKASTDGGTGGGVGGPDGGHPDGGSMTGQPIPLDQLCAAYTTALCTYFTQCIDLGFKDINHCIAETDCRGVATLISEAAAGAVGYDAAGAGACHAQFVADPCHFASFLFTPSIFEVLAQCPGTLTPMQGAGEPCAETRECTSGLYCKKAGNDRVCPGTCMAYRTVGAACSSDALCAPGTLCRDATCRPYAKAGDACAGPADCGPTVFCFNDPTCVDENLWCDLFGTRTCHKGAGLGTTCGTVSSNGATTTIECDGALWCDAFVNESGTCRAVGGAGSPCIGIGCLPGLHCEGFFTVGPTATLGTCLPLSGSGGMCTSPYECESGLACPNGTCGARAGVNEHCGFAADCQTGLFCSESFVCLAARYPGDSCADPGSGCVRSLCRAGTCVDHAKAGQPCAADTDCVSAWCGASGTCTDFSVCSN
jgi:hypothetical protein